MSAHTPDWYAVLGVSADADTDAIRDAWSAAIDGKVPTDQEFRDASAAAEVLLDADARAAYDADLAAAKAAQAASEAAAAAKAAKAKLNAKQAPPAQVSLEKAPVVRNATGDAPWWIVAVSAAVVVLTALVWTVGLMSKSNPTDDEVAASIRSATDAAVAATPVIFAYDYTHLDADRTAAMDLLTGDYAQQYADVFDAVIRGNAVRTKTKVSVVLLDSGVDSTTIEDGTVTSVRVLVLFNQISVNAANPDATTARNFATLVMQHVDGRWLVSKVEGPKAADPPVYTGTTTPDPSQSPTQSPTQSPSQSPAGSPTS